MKAKTFLLGVSVGLLGGLVTSIVTAQQSGEQLRSNIVKTTNSTKDNLSDIKQHISTLKNSVIQLRNEAKNNIPKIISDLKVSITQFSKEIEPDATKLKAELDNLQISIAEIENNLNVLNKK